MAGFLSHQELCQDAVRGPSPRPALSALSVSRLRPQRVNLPYRAAPVRCTWSSRLVAGMPVNLAAYPRPTNMNMHVPRRISRAQPFQPRGEAEQETPRELIDNPYSWSRVPQSRASCWVTPHAGGAERALRDGGVY